jgi:DNA-binding CsgD family transcriptional regulator
VAEASGKAWSAEGGALTLQSDQMRGNAASALAEIIGNIGLPQFEAVVSKVLCDFIGFETCATIRHPGSTQPVVIYDNFEPDGRRGLENYLLFTHKVNPMLLQRTHPGLFRARDYHLPPVALGGLEKYIIQAQDEELGYRTIGWPEKLEEIGFFIPMGDDLLELGFYRERSLSGVSRSSLKNLEALRLPVTVAFTRHAALYSKPGHSAPGALATTRLTGRESQVVDLMLQGCSSEAISLRLAISLHTVKDHRKHIFRKLGIGSLAELFSLEHRSPS